MSLLPRLLCAAFCAATFAACGNGGASNGQPGGMAGAGGAPEVASGPIAFRRLTTTQYASSVRNVLGAHIEVPRRIDPDDRRSGLFAVGASFAGMSASGLEKYEAAATSIASQALDAAHRDTLVGCTPSSATASDDSCARPFLERIGRQLFRRPLGADELATRVDLSREAAEALGDFYRGLEFAVSSLLVSPNFLFRIEQSEPDPADASRQRLTAYTIASRLSYWLWNTTPDDQLLDAAESRTLLDREGVDEQVERMLASSKTDVGTRSFYADVYDLGIFDQGLVTKDPLLFPAYSERVAEDAKEQTLRTIIAHFAADKDYRDLFTTRDTFLTASLAQVYEAPAPTGSGWDPYTFRADGPRAGILTHISLMALNSHPGRSSATLRGKFVREVLLCQVVPAPPPDIDFSIVEDTQGELRTARERLEAHVSNSGCASCHDAVDPIGLALENFDTIGAYRTHENGVAIDASGELDGVAFDDAVGLAGALRDHPNLGPCLTLTLFRYAVGRDPTPEEAPLLDYLQERFSAAEYRISNLIREIAMSDGFISTSGPREAVVVEELSP